MRIVTFRDLHPESGQQDEALLPTPTIVPLNLYQHETMSLAVKL